jgi:hypothetical protein
MIDDGRNRTEREKLSVLQATYEEEELFLLLFPNVRAAYARAPPHPACSSSVVDPRPCLAANAAWAFVPFMLGDDDDGVRMHIIAIEGGAAGRTVAANTRHVRGHARHERDWESSRTTRHYGVSTAHGSLQSNQGGGGDNDAERGGHRTPKNRPPREPSSDLRSAPTTFRQRVNRSRGGVRIGTGVPVADRRPPQRRDGNPPGSHGQRPAWVDSSRPLPRSPLVRDGGR